MLIGWGAVVEHAYASSSLHPLPYDMQSMNKPILTFLPNLADLPF
jgi:hypothetical protein